MIHLITWHTYSASDAPDSSAAYQTIPSIASANVAFSSLWTNDSVLNPFVCPNFEYLIEILETFALFLVKIRVQSKIVVLIV